MEGFGDKRISFEDRNEKGKTVDVLEHSLQWMNVQVSTMGKYTKGGEFV